MGVLVRGKMMAALRALHRKGTFDGFDDFRDPEAFDRLMERLADTNWVVYAKKPFREIHHVLAYLGRYTHRVAISNSRLVDVTERAVTFRTKNGKTVTLSPIDFLRRFLQHVLPEGFHKIRHYGLYSSRQARPGGGLDQARALLPAPGAKSTPAPLAPTRPERLHQLTGRAVTRCPRCGAILERRPLPAPSGRAPPWRLAS